MLEYNLVAKATTLIMRPIIVAVSCLSRLDTSHFSKYRLINYYYWLNRVSRLRSYVNGSITEQVDIIVKTD